MWDDYGGMAYRGEICKKRSLGVDAVSCHRISNILSLLNETLTLIQSISRTKNVYSKAIVGNIFMFL